MINTDLLSFELTHNQQLLITLAIIFTLSATLILSYYEKFDFTLIGMFTGVLMVFLGYVGELGNWFISVGFLILALGLFFMLKGER